jgi:hypothetical protein
MTRRVVVTGLGIVSCLGNDASTVTEALRRASRASALRGAVEAVCDRTLPAGPKSMSGAHRPQAACASWPMPRRTAYLAMQRRDRRRGARRGGDIQRANRHHRRLRRRLLVATRSRPADILRERGTAPGRPLPGHADHGQHRVGLPGDAVRDPGVNYSISSACSTSAHCIGNAMEQIQLNKQDRVFAGGGEELHWTMSSLFDAMGALSTRYNDDAGTGVPGLRCRSRRLRDRRRRRHAGAGSARGRQGPRRENLCRACRLRRHLRWLRYGRTLRRRCGALHAPGAERPSTAPSTTSTRTGRARPRGTFRSSRPCVKRFPIAITSP